MTVCVPHAFPVPRGLRHHLLASAACHGLSVWASVLLRVSGQACRFHRLCVLAGHAPRPDRWLRSRGQAVWRHRDRRGPPPAFRQGRPHPGRSGDSCPLSCLLWGAPGCGGHCPHRPGPSTAPLRLPSLARKELRPSSLYALGPRPLLLLETCALPAWRGAPKPTGAAHRTALAEGASTPRGTRP